MLHYPNKFVVAFHSDQQSVAAESLVADNISVVLAVCLQVGA